MRNTFIDTVLQSCVDRDDVFIISGDAGLGVFDDFKREYPNRFLNLGVAEQNTISFAAGLAMSGRKVYVYNIIPFVLYRCYEQVRNDICYQKLPVTLVGIGSGVTYAPMGMSHYSVEDIGIARTLPNLTILSPSDPVEAQSAARYSLEAQHPVYIRLAKRGEPKLHDSQVQNIKIPLALTKGHDIAVICHGSITEEVLKACSLLPDSISPAVYSLPMLQPLDTDNLVTTFSSYKTVLVVEEHYENCGLGNILSDIWTDRRIPSRLQRLGISHRFIHDIRNTAGMREIFGLSAAKIVETILHIRGES